MISFDNQDKEEPVEKHIERSGKLINSKHWSTAEHQAQVPTRRELYDGDFDSTYHNFIGVTPIYKKGKYVSNIKGWKQLRKLIENEEF